MKEKKGSRHDSTGLGLRSAAAPDLLVDDDAYKVETTNVKRLSRLHWEDLLQCNVGTSLVLYVAKDGEYAMPEVATAQRKVGKANGTTNNQNLSGAKVHLSGREFVCLKARILHATTHHDAIHGMLSLPELKRKFSRKDGFTIAFDDSDETITISWQEVIENSDELLIFGRPFDNTRLYHRLFMRKADETYVKQVFLDISKETWGDHVASYALLSAYQNRMLELSKKSKAKPKVHWIDFFENDKSDAFFNLFDNRCKIAFRESIIKHVAHNKEIIPITELDWFVTLAERFLPNLMKHMYSLRNIQGSYNKTDKKLVQGKKRQVFLQILALRRMRSPRALKWWSLCQAVAFYGWGVGRTALDACTFWGMVCSSSTRDRCLNELTDDLSNRQATHFSKSEANIFVLDNVQRDGKLKDSRGGRTNAFLTGTQLMAHKVKMFRDDSFNHLYVTLDYTTDQDYISPVHMIPYETQADMSDADFFIDHVLMNPADKPEVSGERVRHYEQRVESSKWISEVSRVFTVPLTEDGDVFDMCSIDVNKEKLNKFKDVCEDEKSRQVISSAKTFQRAAVRHWNPSCDEVTETSYLGVSGMDEAASKETAALVLGLAMKGGLVRGRLDGKKVIYHPADDLHARRCYVVGDVKTVDNANRIADILDSAVDGIEGEDESQASILSRVLNHMQDSPGDWHAGLSMVQSINNVCWDGFLDDFRDALQWKKVQKDARNCYYAASRLIKYVYEECVRILMHSFVSNHLDGLRVEFQRIDGDTSNANFMCFVAKRFSDWLLELRDCSDHWVRCCSLFVRMARDFLTFVESYRNGDSIGIELGYQDFAPVWRALGQNRYLERHWRQLETLLQKFPFQWLEEFRRNRTVRKYPGESGKFDVALDECMELANRFFKQFPKTRTLEAFANHGMFVGLAILCKRYVLASTNLSDGDHVYRSAKHPSCVPERRRLYELLLLAKTSTIIPGRTFKSTFLRSFKNQLKTKLTDHALESRIKRLSAMENDDSFQLLSTVSQAVDEILLPAQKDDGSVLTVHETMQVRSESTVSAEDLDRVERVLDDDAQRITPAIVDEGEVDETTAAKSKRLGYNRFMVEDVWRVGTNMLLDDNVRKKRTDAHDRKLRKKAIAKAITLSKRNRDSVALTVIDEDLNVPMPCWTSKVKELFPDLY